MKQTGGDSVQNPPADFIYHITAMKKGGDLTHHERELSLDESYGHKYGSKQTVLRLRRHLHAGCRG